MARQDADTFTGLKVGFVGFLGLGFDLQIPAGMVPILLKSDSLAGLLSGELQWSRMAHVQHRE